MGVPGSAGSPPEKAKVGEMGVLWLIYEVVNGAREGKVVTGRYSLLDFLMFSCFPGGGGGRLYIQLRRI